MVTSEGAGRSDGDRELAAAAALLAGATEATLLTHVNPDADTVGSALALGAALHGRGVRVVVACADPDRPAALPPAFAALDEYGLLVAADAVPAAPPLLVALDAASLDRLGRLAGRVAAAGAALVVDHHLSNTRFGTHHLVDPAAESTTVLVLRLLDAMGVALTAPIARCLYAGLVTDTSSFRRATPATHATAARLIAAGVDPAPLTRSLVDTHPFGWLRMLATVLAGARLDPAAARGAGLVHAVVDQDAVAGLPPSEAESVVDLVRTTAEAEVAAVLKAAGPGTWTVSLRAKSAVDVSAVAVAMGGGGHRLAAGYTAHGSAEDVLAALRTALS